MQLVALIFPLTVPSAPLDPSGSQLVLTEKTTGLLGCRCGFALPSRQRSRPLTEADVNNLPFEAIGKIEQKDTATWAFVPPSRPYSFPCWVGNQQYNCQPHQNWKSNLPESWSVASASFPRTVSEFSRFWDSLGKQNQSEQQNKSGKQDYWVDFVNQIGTGTKVPPTPGTEIEVSRFRTTPASRQVSRDEPRPTVEDKPLWLVSDEHVTDKDGNAKFLYWDKPEKANEGREWEIPVLTRKRIKLDQDALITIFPKKWIKGRFDLAFADLARASRDLEELEFADLREQLKAEAASGSGFFEIAGLKIPSGQVTTVGIIAVLCIQLYLLILLRELSYRLSSDDTSWDVPWIGMFGSRLAHWATWISVAVCPVAAVGLLAWHGLSHATPARVLFVLPLLLACLVASASWSYRPRAQSAPTQPANSP